jgi:glycosyltransferase involved in cell wall biosynthesis
MSEIPVSVALAAYNGENYLVEQLESVLAQTHKNLEIVVCDDCSEDGTGKILDSYAERGLIRYYVNERRMGSVRNFEKVMSLCNGDFIAPCDQDDVWKPEKISTLIEEIGDNLLIHSDAELIDKDGKMIHPSYTEYARKQIEHMNFSRILFKNVVTGCTAFFHRKLYQSACPFPDHVPHDHWLAIVAADKGDIAYCNKALVRYRQHDSNAIGAKKYQDISVLISEDARHCGYYSNRRRDIHYRRFREFSEMDKFHSGKFTGKNRKVIGDYADYFSSYFIKRIRIKAFLINIIYFSEINQGLTSIRKLKRLFYSLIGEGKGFNSSI